MNRFFVTVVAVGIAVVVLAVAIMSISQPSASSQPLRNTYYPFTVEVQVRDR